MSESNGRHSLTRVNPDSGLREWVCSCGQWIGAQPDLSEHKARVVHREHKARAGGAMSAVSAPVFDTDVDA